MTAAELAARHPRLYHLTCRRNVDGIRARGLLSASDLLARFCLSADERRRIGAQRRDAALLLEDGAGNRATISDNAPLSVSALAKCLDPGLTPQDWLGELNRRIFFWVDERRLGKLIGARNNRGRDKTVLVLDTLSVAQTYGDAMELCAINSGATVRRAVRRGGATFTPLGRHGYEAWRGLRGGRDSICEVTVSDAMPDAFRHVVEWREVDAVRA